MIRFRRDKATAVILSLLLTLSALPANVSYGDPVPPSSSSQSDSSQENLRILRVVPDGAGGYRLEGFTAGSSSLNQTCNDPRTWEGTFRPPCCNRVRLSYCTSPAAAPPPSDPFQELAYRMRTSQNPFAQYNQFNPSRLPPRDVKISMSDYLKTLTTRELIDYQDYLKKWIEDEKKKLEDERKKMEEKRARGLIQLPSEREKMEQQQRAIDEAEKMVNDIEANLNERKDRYDQFMGALNDPAKLRELLNRMSPREKQEFITMLEKKVADGQIPPDVFGHLMRMGEWNFNKVQGGFNSNNMHARRLFEKLGYGELLNPNRRNAIVFEGVAYLPPNYTGRVPTMPEAEFRAMQEKLKQARETLERNGITIDPQTGKLTLPNPHITPDGTRIERIDLSKLRGDSPEARALREALDSLHPGLSERLLRLQPGATGDNACAVVDHQVFRPPHPSTPNQSSAIPLETHIQNVNRAMQGCNDAAKTFAAYLQSREGVTGAFQRYWDGMHGQFWQWIGYEPQDWLSDWQEVGPEHVVYERMLEFQNQAMRACIKRLEGLCVNKDIIDQMKRIHNGLSKKERTMIEGIQRDIVLLPIVGVAAAVIAPKLVLAGMVIGTAVSVARQSIQIYVDGCRTEYSFEEMWQSGMMGAYLAPAAMFKPLAVGLCVWGVYEGTQSALIELKQGHGGTAAFDAAFALFLAWGAKHSVRRTPQGAQIAGVGGKPVSVAEFLQNAAEFARRNPEQARAMIEGLKKGTVDATTKEGVNLSEPLTRALELGLEQPAPPTGGATQPAPGQPGLSTAILPCEEISSFRQQQTPARCQEPGRCVPSQDSTPNRSVTRIQDLVNETNRGLDGISKLMEDLVRDPTRSPAEKQQVAAKLQEQCTGIKDSLTQEVARRAQEGRTGMSSAEQTGQTQRPSVTTTTPEGTPPGGLPQTGAPRLPRELLRWYREQLRPKLEALERSAKEKLDDFKKKNPGLSEEEAKARLRQADPEFGRYMDLLEKINQLDQMIRGEPVQGPLGQERPPTAPQFKPKPEAARKLQEVLNRYNELMRQGDIQGATDYLKQMAPELEKQGVKIKIEKVQITQEDLQDPARLAKKYEEARKKATTEWNEKPNGDYEVTLTIPEIEVKFGAIPMDINRFLGMFPEQARALEPFRQLLLEAAREELRHGIDITNGNTPNPLYTEYMRQSGKPFDLETHEFFNRLANAEMDGLTWGQFKCIIAEYPQRLDAFRWWQEKMSQGAREGSPLVDVIPPELQLRLGPGQCTDFLRPQASAAQPSGSTGMAAPRPPPRDPSLIRTDARHLDRSTQISAGDKVNRFLQLASEAEAQGLDGHAQMFRNRAEYWRRAADLLRQAEAARNSGDLQRAAALEREARGRPPQEGTFEDQMRVQQAKDARKEEAAGRRTQIRPPDQRPAPPAPAVDPWQAIYNDIRGGVTSPTRSYAEQYLRQRIDDVKLAAERGASAAEIEGLLNKITSEKNLRQRVRELINQQRAQQPPASPQAIVNDNLEILDGKKKGLKGFGEHGAEESLGGNTQGGVTVNMVVDPKTGRIVQIGNIQEYSPEIRARISRGELVELAIVDEFSLRPNAPQGINLDRSLDLHKLTPEARRNFLEALKRYEALRGNQPRFSSDPAQQRCPPSQAPVRPQPQNLGQLMNEILRGGPDKKFTSESGTEYTASQLIEAIARFQKTGEPTVIPRVTINGQSLRTLVQSLSPRR